MVSPEVQQQLNALIQNYGRNSLNDAASFEALLVSGGGSSRDVDLLVMALRAGVPQAIAAGSTSGPELAQQLLSASFLAPEAAQAAVQSWGEALGSTISFPDSDQVSAPAAVEPEAPQEFAAAPPTQAPIAEAPPVSEPVTPAPAPAAPPTVAPYQPYAAPTQPPAPAQRPAYAPQQYSQQGYQQPKSGSNVGLIVGIVVGILVLAVGGLGYYGFTKAKELNNDVVSTSSTTGSSGLTSSTGSSSGSTGTVSTGAPMDMDAYNTKLSGSQQEIMAATTDFQQKNTTAIAAGSDAGVMDRVAPLYDDYSSKIEKVATDLDGLNPPAEASEIHRKYTANIHQLAVLVGDVAKAAHNNDPTTFTNSANKVKEFGDTAGSELTSLISTAGYDVDTFHTQGKLIKK